MFNYEEYLRVCFMPHIWCPGCGNGVILKSFIRAVHSLGWDKNKIVVVSGIGCSSRAPGYLDMNTLHTTHGRAIAFATGVKLANPELNVVVFTGDGDCVAIGGNHFIHAARRNIDLTVVVFNNYIYGMTGGQVSPTTPHGYRATTAPYGFMEYPFGISELAIAAGATFVARTTVYHVFQIEKFIKKGLEHKGFSVIEILSNCHINFGRRNKMSTPIAILNWLKEHSVPKDKFSEEDKKKGKFKIGILHGEKEREVVEYTQLYFEKINTLKEEKK